MTRWDIAETRRLIEAFHGSRQLILSKSCLRSVADRQAHAQYHYQEIKRLLTAHIDDRLDTKDIYEVTWPTDTESCDQLNYCLLRVEANVIACAQALHSLGDILAHVVYFAVGINLRAKSLAEDGISLNAVADKLLLEPEFSEVAVCLDKLRGNNQFKTVMAIVNHSKHRGLIEPNIIVDHTSTTVPYALQFESFIYRNKLYAEKEIGSVLTPAFEAVSVAVVDSGNALNRALSKKLDSGLKFDSTRK
jgi:hypothetical protein